MITSPICPCLAYLTAGPEEPPAASTVFAMPNAIMVARQAAVKVFILQIMAISSWSWTNSTRFPEKRQQSNRMGKEIKIKEMNFQSGLSVPRRIDLKMIIFKK